MEFLIWSITHFTPVCGVYSLLCLLTLWETYWQNSTCHKCFDHCSQCDVAAQAYWQWICNSLALYTMSIDWEPLTHPVVNSNQISAHQHILPGLGTCTSCGLYSRWRKSSTTYKHDLLSVTYIKLISFSTYTALTSYYFLASAYIFMFNSSFKRHGYLLVYMQA